MVRIPGELASPYLALAESEERSFNAEIRLALKRDLKQLGREPEREQEPA
jgi:hypothetical protein